MLALLCSIASLAGGVTHPVPPGPVHYRVDLSASQDVDASALGGGENTTKFDVTGYVSVTMTDTTGGQLAQMVIDSVTLPAGAVLPQGIGSPDSAKGISFHAYVVQGKVSTVPPPSGPNSLAAIFGGTIGVLFPGVRANARIGDTWTDTTTAKTSDNRTSVTITKWSVTAVNGDEMTVQGAATGTTEGTVSSSQGDMSLKGTIDGTRNVTTTAAGPASHAEATANTQATVTPVTMPTAVISVKGSTTITVTKIP